MERNISMIGSQMSHQGWAMLKGRVSLVSGQRSLRRQVPKQAKPPNLPPAKQMLYRIVDAKWQKPEHVRENLWRRHVYNNAVESMRQLFREEIRQREAQGLGIESLKEEEARELDELIRQQEQRNEKSAEERAGREKTELEEIKIQMLATIEKKLSNEAHIISDRTEEVKTMIQLSKHFITPENLEEKIRRALETPTVYEHAIDLQARSLRSPTPVKYTEGVPTRQKSRLYDRSHAQKMEERTKRSEALR